MNPYRFSMAPLRARTANTTTTPRGRRTRGKPAPAAPTALADLANVGPATVGDLHLLGITTVAQLRRRDAYRLYDELCRRTKQVHDPCVIDVFLSAIDQSNGGPRRPWWHFTPLRKAELARRAKGGKKRARA